MSIIRRVGNRPFSYLNEKTRQELVVKSVDQSPERVERSKQYKITGTMKVDIEDFLFKDKIFVEIPVNQYTCTIEFDNVIQTVAWVADRQTHGNINISTVEKALSKAMDDEKNLKVNCTCPDFYYRYSYVATINKYKVITKDKKYAVQQIPAPIRNPHNNIGSCCKHLLMILKNKKWLQKLASIINQLIKTYYYDLLQIHDLDASNFFINLNGRHNPKKFTIPYPNRSKKNEPNMHPSKYNTSPETEPSESDDEIEDEEEELRLRLR